MDYKNKNLALASLAAILGAALAMALITLISGKAFAINENDPNLALVAQEEAKPAIDAYRAVRLCKRGGNRLSFPDEGYCIRKNVYVILGKDESQLTLLRPGRYSDGAVGSNCSFTVYSNCLVTQ